MQHLQAKNLFLRLNLEQASNILEALAQTRDTIEEESLPLYDSIVEDIFEQLYQQGVRIGN